MKFEKGQWYQYKEHFWQYDDNCFRHAGDELVVKNLSYADELIPATLTPDFSNAKVGDACFCVTLGNKKIDAADNSCAFVHIDLGLDTHMAIYLDGKADQNDTHPMLFNSFAQFLAYWREEAIKLKGGSDA